MTGRGRRSFPGRSWRLNALRQPTCWRGSLPIAFASSGEKDLEQCHSSPLTGVVRPPESHGRLDFGGRLFCRSSVKR